MSELVDRQEVLKVIREMPCIGLGEKEALLDAVKGLSAIEKRKKGHWVVDEDGNIECSECGYSGVGDNYCERCGADMRGEQNAEIH